MNIIDVREEEVWLGTYGSYLQVLAAEDRLAQLTGPEIKAFMDEEEDEDDIFQGYGYMVNQIGATAVIGISGPLITKSNWLTRLFGLTGYDEIRNAAIAAGQAPGIESIILDMDTPGGSAKGVEDAAQTIAEVDAKLAPVYTWTGGTMASAGYWLGMQGREVHATPMSTVGSIGTVAVHQEITEMMKQAGVNATVFRSGEKKALGGPMEKLSGTAKEVIQEKIDSLSDHFIDSVAQARGRTSDYIKAEAGDGSEFWAKDGIGIGLVDGLHSFEEVVNLVDKAHNSPRAGSDLGQPTGDPDMLRKKAVVVTPEMQAAIAAGSPVDTALLAPTGEEIPAVQSDAGGDPAGEEGSAAAQTPPNPDNPTAAADEGGDPPAATPDADPAPPPAAAASPDAVNSLVQELSSVQAGLADVTLRLEQAEAQLTAAQASEVGLMQIAVTAVQHMQVAMGSSGSDLSHLSAEALVAQYHTTRGEFTTRFPVGRQTNVPTDDNRVDTDSGESPPAQAAARASSIKSRKED